MSNRIPVFQTIVRSYDFAFGGFLKNAIAIVVPIGLYGVVSYFVIPTYMSAMDALARIPPYTGPQSPEETARRMQASLEVMSQTAPTIFATTILAFVVFASIGAIVTARALGREPTPLQILLPFGRPLWRLCAAYLLLALIMIGMYFGLIIVVALIVGIGSAARGSGDDYSPVLALAAVGIAMALALTFIYVAVRLTFLLTPSVVAEERITLGRGWALTKGNFWRIVVINLAVGLPVVIVMFGYMAWVSDGWFLPFGASPEHAAAIAQNPMLPTQMMLEKIQRNGYIVYPLGFVANVIVFGLFAGAAALSYRALTEADVPPPPTVSS